MRIVTDIFDYCSKELPNWNTISVSGYHIREAGSTAIEELAFTFSNAIAYVEAAINSGLDVDAMKQVSNGVNSLRSDNRSFLIITHYQRLLNYIKPDFVHVLMNGKIIKSGGPDLALELEKKGYENIN